MELLWLLIIWVMGLYLIRVHLQLRAYRRHLNRHREIYVPSLSEIMQTNHWTIQLARYLSSQVGRNEKAVPEREYSSFGKQPEFPVLAVITEQKKAKA